MNKTIAFIGPLPPPVGGVALANLRVQQIVGENLPNHKVIIFNTSRGLKMQTSTNEKVSKNSGIL